MPPLPPCPSLRKQPRADDCFLGQQHSVTELPDGGARIGGGEGGTVSKASRVERGRETKGGPQLWRGPGLRFISSIPTDSICIQVTSQFSLKQQEETHFMGPKVHFDHFSSTENQSALKMKVSTSVKRGTTGWFEMTVFPSSAHRGAQLPPPPALPVGSCAPPACRSLVWNSRTGAPRSAARFPAGRLDVTPPCVLDFPETDRHRYPARKPP